MVMNSVVRDEALAAKPWEQPLTTADMRARAAEWSLADDSRLLAYLEVLTQSITLRTCGIHKQLEGLVHQAMISGVKVHNVINDFSHLNSLQFVENRVYDEEVQAEAKDAQPPCREEEEGALVEQVSEAFRLGVEVLRSSLEVVDLHQDSEDDDDSDEDTRFRHAEETLLRPLDPYLARPLPSLIGSDQFLRDDCVGLGELLSEDEGEEKSSHGEYDSDKSEVGSDTDEAKEPVIDNKMAIYMQQEFGDTLADSNDAGKFAGDAEELYSDGSDEVSVLKSKERKESAVLSEGCAKVEDVLESSQTLVGQSAQMENASPFSRKSGPFSGGGKLFDDDDNDYDEGDLFRDGLTSRPPNKAGAASFGNEEQNTSIEGVVRPDASAGSEENVIVSMAQNTTATREVLASALFDEEDYSDLWTSTPTTGLPGLSPSEDQSDKCSLFDDGQDDLFPTTNAAVKTGSKLERSLFSDEEEDIFASAKSALAVSSGHPTKPDLFVNSTVETKCRKSSTGIFLFEDDSDGLKTACPAALVEKPQDPVKAYGRRPTNEPISLFATEEEVGDDDEDLFTVRPTHLADNQSSRSVQSVSWSIESKGDAESTSVVEAVLEKPVAKPRSESCLIFDQEKDIFQSSEENLDVDLFAPTKPTEQKKPPGGVSLFGGSSLLGDELRNRLGKAVVPLSPEVLAATPVPDNSSPKEEVFADPKRQPLLRDTRVISVGFDKPADQSKTLISATKGRAKVNAKRRLPSRKKLQTDARCSDGDGQDSAVDGVLFPSSHGDAAGVTHSGSDAKPTINPSSLKPALKVIKSPSTEEEDLFSVNSLHPVPAEHKLSQVTGAPAAGSQVPFGKGVFGDDREDDLFATCVESSDEHVTSSHGQSSSGAIFGAEGTVLHWSDDCLSGNTAASRDAKAPPQKAPRKVSSNIFEDCDDDDDIFASEFEKSGKSALSSQAKRNALFSDDNDDIFSSMPANVSMVEKKGSQPTTRKCLPRTTNFKDPLLGDNSD